MALLGMVFLLGSAQAAAQVTITPSTTNPDEGGRVTFTVGGTVPVAAGGTAGNTLDVIITPTIAAGDTDQEEEVSAAEAPGDPGADYILPAAITISVADSTTATTRDVEGMITLQTHGDPDDAEDEVFNVTFTLTGDISEAAFPPVPPATDGLTTQVHEITINDTDTQMFVWSPEAPELKEGGSTTEPETVAVTLTARPTPGQFTYPTTLVLEGATGYTLSGDGVTGTFATDALALTATITAPMNDLNRIDDPIMLRALKTGSVTNLTDPLSITVEDIHKLPMVKATLTDADDMPVTDDMVTEGMTYTLTVTVVDDEGMDATAAEALTVSLSQTAGDADMNDYRLSMDEIAIASGGMSGEVSLTVAANDDLDDEMLMFSAVVMGDPANDSGANASDSMDLLSLTIKDATTTHVWALDTADAYIATREGDAAGADGLNPDDDFSLMNSMLFEVADGYTMRVDAKSNDAAVSVDDSAGDSIMIMPESAGMATITVTATAIPPSSATRQLSVSVAEITFDLTVDAIALEVPGAPTGVTATDATTTAGNGMVTLAWTAPADDGGSPITSYEYRDEVDGRMGDWTDTGSTATSLTMAADIGTA
ncbi:MAG: fibronectin type III domain-containing protein, partial [Rhodococcus sp.]|nr:fibronectin type III domain-containing protein [Rhodococcus sp. (in: high G+C Gram-positive bacteria)]